MFLQRNLRPVESFRLDIVTGYAAQHFTLCFEDVLKISDHTNHRIVYFTIALHESHE